VPLRVSGLCNFDGAHMSEMMRAGFPAVSNQAALSAGCAGAWMKPCARCAVELFVLHPTPTASAPGLGFILPHPHRDWAHPSTSAPGLGSPLHICTRTGLAATWGRFSTRCLIAVLRPISFLCAHSKASRSGRWTQPARSMQRTHRLAPCFTCSVPGGRASPSPSAISARYRRCRLRCRALALSPLYLRSYSLSLLRLLSPPAQPFPT
jgi:hypothetical protein